MHKQHNQNQHADAPPPTAEVLCVGIDWADTEHVVCVIDRHDEPNIATLQQSPQAIDEWVAELGKRFPGQTVAIAVEQSKGPLIHALMKYEQLVLYPINPKQLSRYRDAIHPSGGKDDPRDAVLLARFLMLHFDQLRPWQPDTEATRKLGRMSEIRRKIVDGRTRLTQQLTNALKQYFPLMAERLSERTQLALVALRRWPTLQKLQRVRPATLRRFLKENGLRNRWLNVLDACSCFRHRKSGALFKTNTPCVRNEQQQTEWIAAVRDAVPLTRDQAIIEPDAVYAKMLAEQIQKLSQTLADLDKRIAVLTSAHPDREIYRSLPGAGDALVPRLIAALGSDRDRWESAEQIQCYSGIAPVTRQSGKTRHVSSRHACPKFLKQTFHEFADHARKWSDWSRAFYQQKRAAGCKHQAAVRALAFKWIRIIFRLWKTRTTYDENTYDEQLRRRNSPLVPYIQNS